LALVQQQARLDPSNIARLAAQQGGGLGVRTDPRALAAGAGQVFTPPTAPPEVQALIDAGAKVRLALAQGAEETRLGAIQTRQEVALAGLDFASNIAAAIRSGSPSGIFGAATGGIGGLISIFNPLAGQIFSTVGGIFAGLLPNGRDNGAPSPARAAGANVSGAPAISINIEQNNSLSVLGLPQVGEAMNDALNRLTRVIETSIAPRLGRLEVRTNAL
jgi:hypothetical protein